MVKPRLVHDAVGNEDQSFFFGGEFHSEQVVHAHADFVGGLGNEQVVAIVAKRVFNFIASHLQAQHGVGANHGDGHQPPAAGVDEHQRNYHDEMMM